MREIIEFDNVSFAYSKDLVLSNVSFKLNTGDFLGVVGTNGSGKSTLLKLILGVIKPTEGRIIKALNLHIGYINQTTTSEESSFPQTVYETVSLGLKNKPFSFIKKSEKERVLKTLELFNLKNLKDRPISSLSGGQEQKVKIAKVILANPDLIIFDEPTTGIDQESREVLNQMILHLHAQKKTIILVSHNEEDLRGCNRILKIEDGGLNDVRI
jgi:zinc transport system ATP-binding protein